MNEVDQISENGPVAGKRNAFGERPNTLTAIAIITGIAALSIAPMVFMGIPDGYDLLQHIRFAAAYRDSLLAGQLFPVWAADDNFGFGSIGIRYYPPFAYYLLALTKILTGSWFHSFWINSFVWMFAGSLGIYLWVREWTASSAALLAAAIYVIVPYHTFQIYQAVLFAEFAAAGVLPFCFLFLTRVCRRRRWIDAVALGCTYALLVLTHIPTTLIATISLAVYSLLIIEWRHFIAISKKLGVAAAISLSAAGFHLVRLISEMGWVIHNSPTYFASGYYDYKRYLFPIWVRSPP